MRGASFAPGNTQDICRFLSSPEFMCVPLHPSSFPSTQQLGVSGSQPVTLWRARQIQAQYGKHITSVSAWEHLALPGCEGPSVCLSDSEPTHTVGVYWCCHGSTVFTPTQVLVYYTNNQQSLQYQSKQAKCHNQTQDYFMNIKLNH